MPIAPEWTQLAAIIAPAKFRGDLRACAGGSFSFDGRTLGTGGSGYSNPDFDHGSLRITGPAGNMVVDLLPGTAPGNAPPTDAWARHTVPFIAASFGQTQVQLEAILANVTEVRSGVEALFGPEIQGIDDFRLAPAAIVPALPMAGHVVLVALLGALGAGLAHGTLGRIDNTSFRATARASDRPRSVESNQHLVHRDQRVVDRYVGAPAAEILAPNVIASSPGAPTRAPSRPSA